MKAVLRASRIGRVILRYRLDDLLHGTPAERWLRLAKPFVPRASADIAVQSRGARLRLALQDLGPIFVKFGQILSTRRDLVPPDVANELTLLQDRVKPFDGDTARRIVEDHRAGPAHALPAGGAGAGQVEVFVQQLGQHEVGGNVERPDRLPVDRRRERDALGHHSTARMRSAVTGVR